MKDRGREPPDRAGSAGATNPSNAALSRAGSMSVYSVYSVDKFFGPAAAGIEGTDHG